MTGMNFYAILFDLDGTLLDTLHDLADSMNAVLARMGFAPHYVDAYRYFVGDGVLNLARRALPESARDERTVASCAALMREEYDRRWADKTRPYPGVPELLEWLHAREVKLAVLSNKGEDFTRKTVARFLPSGVFAAVRGYRDDGVLKPDPRGALAIARELGLPPTSFLYLGDTATDMKTAIAAGMCPVGALWGFRTVEELADAGAKHLIENPQQIRDFY